MINNNEFIEVKLVQLELEFISFIGGNIKFRKIDIKRI
jgi:hypothetical protein